MRSLIAAEVQARALFDECARRGVIATGKLESAVSDEIRDLARELFGIEKYWHKRIVRAGSNTLCTYDANPPDLVLQPDDIVFCDFGPIFDDWEADFGLTVVLGDDARKRKLATDIERSWDDAAAYYRATPDITAAQLYAYAGELAQRCGWELGHIHCGHVVGRFPHEQIEGDEPEHYLRADNPRTLRRQGVRDPLRWILEIHFVDREAGYGGFQEALLREPQELA